VKSGSGRDTGAISIAEGTITAVTFTNTYTVPIRDVDVVTLNLEGTKILTTLDDAIIPVVKGEFVFKLTQGAGNPADGCTWNGHNPVGVSAGGAIDFGTLTFTKEGTYVFTIREAAPNPAPMGWFYDTDDVTVTVVVENDNGQLKIVSTTYSKGGVEDTGVNFVNKCGVVLGTDSTLIITKVDNNGVPLSGIEFYLMVSNDGGTTWADYGRTHVAPYASTNEFGILVFRDLAEGMYKIVEITQDPQYGAPVYSPSDTFTILEDETLIIEITVVNPLKTPMTGDDFPAGQWVVLSGLAVIGMIVPVVLYKRRKDYRMKIR